MSEVITEEYRQLQMDLHKNPDYGVASLGYAPIVADLVRTNGIKSLADYGAGKCNLRKGLARAGVRNIDYYPYDPAFPEYGNFRAAELICCIDVLEHIEPAYLDNVLGELAAQMPKFGFFTVHTGPAQKVLADGRNAHLIQQPVSWWLGRLGAHFEALHLQTTEDGKGFWIVVSRKGAALAGGAGLSWSHYLVGKRSVGHVIKRWWSKRVGAM
jgi:hypothetical protein